MIIEGGSNINGVPLGVLSLESSDMSSFARSIQQKVKLPIFDLTTLTNMVYACVVRKTYSGFVPR